jgi:hypothetical protein
VYIRENNKDLRSGKLDRGAASVSSVCVVDVCSKRCGKTLNLATQRSEVLAGYGNTCNVM